MTEIQQTRWDRTVRRVANIVAPGSMVNDALNELFPMFDIENLPGELYVLGGTQLCAGRGTVVSGGGLFARVALRNPDDSGHLITVTTVIISHNQPAVSVRWGLRTAVLADSIGTEVFRDGRTFQSAPGRPVGEIFTDSLAIPGPISGETRLLGDTPLTLNDENGVVVLNPGVQLECSSGTVAHSFNTAFFWRERPAEPAELNL